MVDFPVEHVQIVQSQVVVDSNTPQSSEFYEMSEVDLSFCDSLACLCSGDASSGPSYRPTTGSRKTT